MNGPIEFTREQLLHMCRSYKAGASLDALSSEFGISKTAVASRLRANNVKLRARGCPPGGRSQAAKEVILKMFESGKNIHQIAEALSVTVRTIYRRLAS